MLSDAKSLEAHTFFMEIGNKIRRARKARGWSQRFLAAEMKVSGSAVAQWELGSSLPTLDNRIELSQKLGIPIADLLPAGAVPEELVVSDPQELLLLTRFRRLSPPSREAFLKLLVVQSDLPGDPTAP